MTLEELKAEVRRRLERDHGVTDRHPSVRRDIQEDYASLETRYTMTLDHQPFVSWVSSIGYGPYVWNVVWHLDEIGQPDLSFKGINKFKGRWEGGAA